MKENIALIIDTNSNYSDVWPPCFDRLRRHIPSVKKYAFTDRKEDIPSDIIPVLYNNSETYRNQFLSCIKQISEKYIIYTSEDYILFGDVNTKEIEKISEVLDNTDYSFCKFIKGPENTEHMKDNLFIIDQESPNLFAQQASLWDTRDFESIFEAAPSESTRMQHEPQGSRLCRELGIKGLQHYSGNSKRGLFHYDSEIFSCVATAVVKGLWNLTEYPEEMKSIGEEYKINYEIRGWR
tara:strand:- start:802 stop:1515 length:714 start_codon:yes stop_codon:yes gene_type:complete